jgi:hypothetical protein
MNRRNFFLAVVAFVAAMLTPSGRRIKAILVPSSGALKVKRLARVHRYYEHVEPFGPTLYGRQG